MFTTTKLATAAVTGVLTLAVTGAAAFAAFQPAETTTLTAAIDSGSQASVQADREGKDKDKDKDKNKDKGDGLKAVLDRLVANGTITQAQEEAILKAFKDAAGHREDGTIVKRILGDLMKLSADYLGIDREALGRQLKDGKSLGEIASATSGKSKEGLITYLVAQVSAQLDQAVAEGKITKERADEAKKGLVEHVTKFVDHKYERKPQPKRADKRPTAAPTAKPTT
jgi:polyhydroxyalkanoate synthesis regulator phasin